MVSPKDALHRRIWFVAAMFMLLLSKVGMKQMHSWPTTFCMYASHGRLEKAMQHAEHGSLWAKISKLLGRYTYNITEKISKLLGRYTYNIMDKWRDLKLIATHKTGLIQQSELERVASLVYKFARTKSLLRNEDAKEDRRERGCGPTVMISDCCKDYWSPEHLWMRM